MKIEVGGLIKVLNPAYEIIAAKPSEKGPGATGLEFSFPMVVPPLTVRIYFDRNAGEELLNKFREALDASKGLVK